MTFNSLTRSSNAVTLVFDRTILTATVLDISSDPLIPTASAFTTTPKHPAPNCGPID